MAALMDAVVAGQRLLRARMTLAMRTDPRSARLLADHATAQDLDLLLSHFVGALGTGAATGPDLARIGADWADRRHPLGDALLAYRVALRVTVDRVRSVAGRTASEPAETLRAVETVLAVCTAMAGAVAAGYRAAEAGQERPAAERRRAEFVRAVLAGGADPAELAARAAEVGVEPQRDYVAVRARAGDGVPAADLARAYGLDRSGGMYAAVDGCLIGFLPAPPVGVGPGVCGVGPPRPATRLHESFRVASRALDTAERAGLTGVQDFAGLGLLPAVCADSPVGAALDRRYLAPLGDSDTADEIINTLRAYLAHGMHAGRAAASIFVHPNTVRYRLCRFEELAGTDLRTDPAVAFEVLWALEYRRLHLR
jgi:hypothetical protein